jgi:hypothetical protein
MYCKVYLNDSCNTVYLISTVGFKYAIVKPCLRAIINNNNNNNFGTDQSVNMKGTSVF